MRNTWHIYHLCLKNLSLSHSLVPFTFIKSSQSVGHSAQYFLTLKQVFFADFIHISGLMQFFEHSHTLTTADSNFFSVKIAIFNLWFLTQTHSQLSAFIKRFSVCEYFSSIKNVWDFQQIRQSFFFLLLFSLSFIAAYRCRRYTSRRLIGTHAMWVNMRRYLIDERNGITYLPQ